MRSCLFNLALRFHYVAWFGSGWYHEIDGTKQVTRGRRRQRALNLIELKKSGSPRANESKINTNLGKDNQFIYASGSDGLN